MGRYLKVYSENHEADLHMITKRIKLDSAYRVSSPLFGMNIEVEVVTLFVPTGS